MTPLTDPPKATRTSGTAPTVAEFLRTHRLSIAAAALGLVCLYWTTVTNLVHYWSEHGDYSHGFLILPISAWILFTARRELGALPCQRSTIGLVVLVASLVLLLLGGALRIHSIERFSMWSSIIGLVWFTLGGSVLRAKLFPFCFLLLAIPPPYFVLQDLRLALKDFATGLSSEILLMIGVPAMPEGNVLVVGAQRFEVVDACSGIRSLVAITTTAILIAYIVRAGWLRAGLLCASAIPITVLVNIARLISVVYAATAWNIDLAAGWAHSVLGLVTYALSLLSLAACWSLMSAIVPISLEPEEELASA